LTALVVPTFELAALAFMGRNVLANLGWPLQQSLLMTRVAPTERASAAGVGFAVWGFTNALGPGLGGAMLEAGALSLPLVVGGVAYGIGGLAFGVGFGRVRSHGSSVMKEGSDRDGR
jgi:predicted MFS family arabinose efflux permease